MCGMNAWGAQWHGGIFIQQYTSLKMVLLLHKTALVNFPMATTVDDFKYLSYNSLGLDFSVGKKISLYKKETCNLFALKFIGTGLHWIEHNPQFSEVVGRPKCFLGFVLWDQLFWGRIFFRQYPACPFWAFSTHVLHLKNKTVAHLKALCYVCLHLT